MPKSSNLSYNHKHQVYICFLRKILCITKGVLGISKKLIFTQFGCYLALLQALKLLFHIFYKVTESYMKCIYIYMSFYK